MNRLICTDLPMSGLALIERQRLGDSRGFLSRLFCAEELNKTGWKKPIAQINHTLTSQCGTVRGMHFQHPPYAEMKLVTCIRGQVWDVVVDLREDSPTFLHWHAEILSRENNRALLIPEGFAHGFQTLVDDVELLYMGMPEQLANAGLRPDLEGISQLNNIGRAVGPGETAEGYLFSDTWQMQFTASHVFGPKFGSDNFVLLGEVGYVNVVDMPDPNVIRLNAPGTARTPSLEPINGNSREGLHQALSDGPETNPFATDDAWGYRLLAVAD